MTSKASKNKSRSATTSATARQPRQLSGAWLAAIPAVAMLWVIVTTGVASRVHFVMGYNTLPVGPTQLEPFMASYAAWIFCMFAMGLWCWLSLEVVRASSAEIGWVLFSLLLATLPLLVVMLLRVAGLGPPPNYWEPLWLSGWSGLSFASLVQSWSAIQPSAPPRRRWDIGFLASGVGVGAVGWAWQAEDYYDNFLLGYNDFGHFAQRVANTAEAQGFLLESPVLPTFWDHFNPGLLLLVPLWKIFPSVSLFFALQALALASGALMVWGIASRQGLGRLAALLFGLAWLAQPVLGQMNLAYTYGWHPITLAIPLLLAGLWALLAKRLWLALLLTLLAMSMEEGVIVVVCLFCASCAAQAMWPLQPKRLVSQQLRPERPDLERPVLKRPVLKRLGGRLAAWRGQRSAYGISPGTWLLLAAVCGVAFVLVYRWSGLAEFQTARFISLGDSAWKVILSPVLRPAAFWGSLLRWDKLYFVLSLWLPCFIPSLLRGWRVLLASALPLLVLVVWDHQPASSLAFQYASTLLPLFWLATIQGTHSAAGLANDAHTTTQLVPRATGVAAGALATGLVLSLFVGQLPYSSPTLLDVVGASYGAQGDQPRGSQQADGRWLTAQVQRIRQEGSAVLATGRIAAHVVGNRDVETVGQYLLRRPQLAALPDRLGNPIAHYRWIIVDRREGFQQSPAEIAAVEVEALQAGFQVVAEDFDIVIMTQPQD